MPTVSMTNLNAPATKPGPLTAADFAAERAALDDDLDDDLDPSRGVLVGLLLSAAFFALASLIF